MSEDPMSIIKDLVENAEQLGEMNLDPNRSEREYREKKEYVDTGCLCVLDLIEDAVKAERERIIKLFGPTEKGGVEYLCAEFKLQVIYGDRLREILEPKP